VKFFYRSLIQIDEFNNIFEKEELAVEEKEELVLMVKDTIHHRVVETVLTHLPEEYHKEFLKTFTKKPDDEGILNALKEKVEDIEEKIKEAVEQAKSEILTDLQSEK